MRNVLLPGGGDTQKQHATHLLKFFPQSLHHTALYQILELLSTPFFMISTILDVYRLMANQEPKFKLAQIKNRSNLIEPIFQ